MMDKVEVKRVWTQFKNAVEQQTDPKSFYAGISLEDFSLIHDLSSNGLFVAEVLNCSLNTSSQKVICKQFRITDTLKEFRPRVEIELTPDSSALVQEVLELYRDLVRSSQNSATE